jgi:hypothetical protein
VFIINVRRHNRQLPGVCLGGGSDGVFHGRHDPGVSDATTRRRDVAASQFSLLHAEDAAFCFTRNSDAHEIVSSSWPKKPLGSQ